MPTFYPVPLAGTPITADLLQSMLPQMVEKTADEQRVSTTSNTNDLHLFYPVEANAVYVVEGLLLYSARDDTDIKIGFTGPSGATFDWTCHAQNPTSTGGLTAGGIVVDRQVIGNTAFPLGGFGAENTTYMTALLRGRIDTAGTAGTFNLNWSQRVTNATAAIMRAGSWLKFQRTS